MTTAVLNRFIARSYYDANNRYILDRIAEAPLIPAGTAQYDRDQLIASLSKQYPDVDTNYIRDHVNVLYGEKPDLPFFRVANHWNYKKIENEFSKKIFSGMSTGERYLRDFNTHKRKIYYGQPDKSVLEFLDTQKVEYSAVILDRSCRFVMGPNPSHVEKFIAKFKREWPPRMVSVTRITFYAGVDEDWSVHYEDGYLVTTNPKFDHMDSVTSTIVPFMTIEPLNVIVWESCLLKHLKEEVVVAHYMRHAIYRSIADAHEMVTVDYTKANSMLVSIRAVDYVRLLALSEKVIAARNEYAKFESNRRSDKKALAAVHALVAPVLPHIHNFNYRELKLMTYSYVYGLANDPRLISLLREYNLPNLIVQADHKFYRKMKEESMKAMVKFAARIDLDASVVCTYSRRPFMRPVLLKGRDTIRRTFLQCLPPSQEKSASTNKYSFFKQTIVQGRGSLVKFALLEHMREYFPVATQKGSDYSFLNVPNVTDKARMWKEILRTYTYMTANDVGFVVFLWNEKNNAVSRDLQAMGKLNARLDLSGTNQPRGVCYYVVGDKNFRYAVVDGTTENVLWSAPSKPFLTGVCINMIKASVSLRRYLVTRELQGAEYSRMFGDKSVDPADIVAATVYCPRTGSDSAFFGNAVFFSRRRADGTKELPFKKLSPSCLATDVMTVCTSNESAVQSPRTKWYVIAMNDAQQHLCEYLRLLHCDELRFAYLFYKLHQFASMSTIFSMLQHAVTVHFLRPVYCGTTLALYPNERLPPASVHYAVIEDFWTFAHEFYFWNMIWDESRPSASEITKYVDEASAASFRKAERDVITALLSREGGVARDLTFVKRMMFKYKPSMPYLESSKIALVINEMMIEERERNIRERAVASVLYGGDLYAIKKFMKHLKENLLHCSDTTVYINNDCKVIVDKTSQSDAAPNRCSNSSDEEDGEDDEDDDDEEMVRYGDVVSKKSTYDNRYTVALAASHSNTIHVYDNSIPILI